MSRPADFDLGAALARPGFTPAQRDAPALVDLIVTGDDRIVTRATPALAGLGAVARDAITARLGGTCDAGGAARLVAALGLLARAGDRDARAALIVRLADPEVRVRRAATVALGKLGATNPTRAELRAGADRRAAQRRDPPKEGAEVVLELREDDGDAPRRLDTDRRADDLADVRAALVARWDAPALPPDERRALAEALGKVGGPEALARLTALDAASDAELARRRDRALLMVEREARRGEDSTIATGIAPAAPLRVRLRCRAGLGELLAAELATRGLGRDAACVRDDAVDVTLDAPWEALFAARLWSSGAIRVPLAAPTTPAGDRHALASSIVATITSAHVHGLMTAWTRGPIRWRLGVAHGHQRALIWRVAREVTRLAPSLVNDPAHTTWDLRLDEDARALELVPRRVDDPRFAYRVADIPAASHPTVAVALAWLADARAGDRVWDPFCGSGLELIERARRGPVRSLLGTDLDDAALEAARANAAAAGVEIVLQRADARTHEAGTLDLILTNPPLGSRVHVDAAALLVTTGPRLARQLAPGGRLVWITPAPRHTTPALVAAGLTCARSLPVDLGGVRGRLERWDKR